MALTVDKEKCISCMTCISMFPNNFRLADDGKSEVFSEEGLSEEDMQTAIDSCASSAISK